MKITLDWINSQTIATDRLDREIKLNCPNCDDTSQHLYINMKKLVWYCFKCGKGGKIEDNQVNVEQFENKVTTFRDMEIVEIQKKVYKEITQVKSLPMHEAFYLPHIMGAANESNDLRIAKHYLEARGITQKEIHEYDISLSIEKNGPFKKSIVFPVYSMFPQRHTLEYFVCRRYDGSKPKYCNAPWPKDNTLFIADANRGGPNYPWVICEGIFDALAVRRVGYNALALLGKTPTSQQLKRLTDRDRYLIYLDEDAFSHAIGLKLQLGAVGTKAQLIVHKTDAADLYLEDATLLRSLLDGATKQLNEYKK